MGTVLKSKTLSVSIECKPDKVYEYARNVEHFPEWATSFCLSVQNTGGEWVIQTPDGPMNIRFVEKNGFGVLDHTVTLPSGEQVFNPMRVIPNGSGSEVVFTLFQLPGMSDEKFVTDAGMVEQDLRTLKAVLEKAEREAE